ncbi:hypothetical protein C8R46DRAFT_1137916 [Mycena filopes]|nr:hypothetical protein C8R46DRAFT_1137916 [Mycena filopes]
MRRKACAGELLCGGGIVPPAALRAVLISSLIHCASPVHADPAYITFAANVRRVPVAGLVTRLLKLHMYASSDRLADRHRAPPPPWRGCM